MPGVTAVHLADAAGQRVGGTEALTHSEIVRAFKPAIAWAAGQYRIGLHPDFEKACGDEVGNSFGHPVDTRGSQGLTLKFVIDKAR